MRLITSRCCCPHPVKDIVMHPYRWCGGPFSSLMMMTWLCYAVYLPFCDRVAFNAQLLPGCCVTNQQQQQKNDHSQINWYSFICSRICRVSSGPDPWDNIQQTKTQQQWNITSIMLLNGQWCAVSLVTEPNPTTRHHHNNNQNNISVTLIEYGHDRQQKIVTKPTTIQWCII